MARFFRQTRLFSRRRPIAYLAFVLICVAILLISLIAADNLRIAVRRYDVPVVSLPAKVQGYTILHLSDLHGQYFGENHARLKQVIDNENYDLVVITGDLLDRKSGAEGVCAVCDLVDLFILRGKPVYYVTGNHDPLLTAPDGTGHPFYAELAAHGAKLLSAPTALPLGEDTTLWLYPMELFYITIAQAQNDFAVLDGIDPAARSYAEKLLHAQSAGILDYAQNRAETDVVLALSHYPMTQSQLKDFALRVPESDAVLRNIDLMLCGHYHHGQVRLPLLGALYVPASDQGLHGFFPDEDQIYGMVDLNGLTMHISAGLGSSSRLPLRIMATPEITFLRLTRQLRLD